MIEPLGGNLLDGVRKAGSSTGAVIEVVASGVPAGLGAPIYGKLDADLAAAMMSINAVKGVEIGAGFAAAALSGEDNADEMRMEQRQGHLPLQQCRRHPGRHLHRPGHRRSLRGQADQLDPDAAPDGQHRGRRHRDLDQGPPRPLRRHPRRAGGRSDDGDRAGRSSAAPPRAVRVGRPVSLPSVIPAFAGMTRRETAVPTDRKLLYRRNTPTSSRCADQGNWSIGRRRSRRKPPSIRSRASRAKLRGSQET